MKYDLLKEVLTLVEQFEKEYHQPSEVSATIQSFKRWIWLNYNQEQVDDEISWEGKDKGRGMDSVINTLIVHMNRYAKSYSKSAIYNSAFATQDDFIYLINLQAFGPMTKMELIKKNIHDKPAGMQIINRLIQLEWIDQKDSASDKRSKIISISTLGEAALLAQMGKIRQATQIVTGDLTNAEKKELIRLLTKLNNFHLPIYEAQVNPEHLLDHVINQRH